MWQLRLSPLTEDEQRVGEQIIGNLDQNGYLAATPEEIALQEKVDPAFVEEVLKKIQEFDPIGIAARDLRECLLIQARMAEGARPLLEKIILGHLKDLEIKNYDYIARKLKAPLADILAAVVISSNMDPKPGSVYNEERTGDHTDVYVIKSGDDYKIVLNDDGLPRLRISNLPGDHERLSGGEGANGRIISRTGPVGDPAH